MSRLALILFLLFTPLSYALDPPEVIFQLTKESNIKARSISDQDHDGFDDLLIVYVNDEGIYEARIIYGAADISYESDWIYTPTVEDDRIGMHINYIGTLDGEHEGCFMWARFGPTDGEREDSVFVDVFYGNDELDTEIDFVFAGDFDGLNWIGSKLSNNPNDLNNDGYHEMILSNVVYDGESFLNIFFGSDSNDFVADWEFDIPEEEDAGALIYSSGLDLNGDGFQDLFVRIGEEYNQMTYRIFLGGEEISEEPALSYDYFPWRGQNNENSAKQLIGGFSMINDINGDSYDDWIHQWRDANLRGGMLIFYGGEELDYEPDLSLNVRGYPSNGDFNGDGLEDMVILASGTLYFFFGKEEFSEEADFVLNTYEEYDVYGINNLKAIGDFNGDGSDDFVISRPTVGISNPMLLILSGWKNNKVETGIVSENYDLSLTAYPNPFNSTVNISFQLPRTADATLTIFDLQGREVSRLLSRTLAVGKHSALWEASDSGVYFAVLEFDGSRSLRKVVALK